MVLGLILLVVGFISLLSFIGVFSLLLNEKLLERIKFIFVAFAAGSLLGAAFFDLIPEAVSIIPENVFLYVLLGIVAFYMLERVIFWRHCHEEKCDAHTFTHLNLIGDGVHNFIDGAIIAASFLVSIPLGVVTSIAVIFHEIPQEIGDFGVLLYGGFSKTKALFFNFIFSLTAFAGAIFAYFFASKITILIPFLLSFAAGGFIYIAASDLIPELHKERDFKRSFLQLIAFLVGIFMIYGVGLVFGG